MKTNQEKYAFYKKTSRYQFCDIPNTEEGEELIRLMRKFLNRDRYTLRVKGQNLDKEKYPQNLWSHGSPRHACTHLRVYIDDKQNPEYQIWKDARKGGLETAKALIEKALGEHV